MVRVFEVAYTFGRKELLFTLNLAATGLIYHRDGYGDIIESRGGCSGGKLR